MALSRCQRLQDVHLQQFKPGAIKAPARIKRALAMLKQQQHHHHIAHAKDNAWRALFHLESGSGQRQLSVVTLLRLLRLLGFLRFLGF